MTDLKKPAFGNPYESLPKESTTQIVSRVATNDYYLVKCTRPGLGTITGTMNTLWLKLSNELRRLNITDVSATNEFEAFLANCRIVDGRLGSIESDQVTIPRADYEILKNDSEHWQMSLIKGQRPVGPIKRTNRRRVPSGSVGGIVASGNSDDSGSTSGTCDKSTDNANELPDVQGECGKQ